MGYKYTYVVDISSICTIYGFTFIWRTVIECNSQPADLFPDIPSTDFQGERK